MNPLHRTSAALAVVALGVAALAGCAPSTDNGSDGGGEPVELTFATYVSPTAPHGQALEWMIEEISARSDGRITIEPFWDGSLLAGPDLLAGVAQGQADLAFMTPLYNPSDLPLSQVSTIPFQNSDLGALSDAMTTLEAENADYQAEWSSKGVQPLTFIAVPPAIVAANEPIEDLDWFPGKSVRSSGYAAFAVQAAGGTPVTIVVNELYESMQRGLVQGYTSITMDVLPSLSLQEVGPYVSDAGLGTYGFNSIIANPDVWNGLSADDQALIQGVIDEVREHYFENLSSFEDEACDAILEAGGQVTVWDESEKKKWAALVGDGPFDDWSTTAAAGGADTEAFFEDYQSAIEDSQSGSANNSAPERCAAR